MSSITAVIRLSRPQGKVFASKSRFRIVVAGRRFGKTHLAVAELIRAASTKSNQICWYVGPTYRQTKRIAWLMLKNYIPHQARLFTNEQELTIGLKNGSVIVLIGVDSPDSLRGANCHFCIIDEFAEMDSYVWSGIIRPILAASRGRALFIGTPKGYNHMYDFYMAALTTADWERFHFTSMDGRKWNDDTQEWERIISDDEIKAVKNDPTIPERLFKQEYYASFENLSGRVYYAFSRELYEKGNLHYVMDDKASPICVGMDFNVNPMTCVIGQKHGTQAHVFKEIVVENSNTSEMMKTIADFFPGRDVVVYPDPSGNQRKTSAPLGATDINIIKNTKGINVQVWTPGHAYPIVDRLNTTNGMLCNAAGTRNLLIHPSLKHLIKCLDGLTIKKGTNLPDKSLGIEHVGDGLGYWIMGMFPMIRKGHAQVFDL